MLFRSSNRVLGPGRLRFEPRQPSAAARDDRLAQELWMMTEARLQAVADQASCRVEARL